MQVILELEIEVQGHIPAGRKKANVKPPDPLTSSEEYLLGHGIYRIVLMLLSIFLLAWFTTLAVVKIIGCR